jgi:para-aminobenzoate synthetase/4-amino-4-deoxychorismate lyase
VSTIAIPARRTRVRATRRLDMSLTALPDAPFALFDDSLSTAGQASSLLLADLDRTIVCDHPDQIDSTLARMDAAAAAGRHLAIVADYELGYWLEPKAFAKPAVSGKPLLQGFVFRRAQNLDGNEVAAFLAAHRASLPPSRRIAGIADLQPMLDEAGYLAAIRRILAYIAEGDCYQVDFTFPLHFRHYGDPLALYARLRQAQPVHHGAYVQLPDRSLLSLSPELFLERRGDRLTTRPMKGTAPRGADAATDAAYRDELAASEKNRAENLMIVDLIRNDLGRLARLGSVRVDRLFDIEPYPTVWQMTSTVSAEAPGASLATIFRALFPCGSVTGAPKIRAMQIAAELEPGPRGVYTGAIGYLRPGGDFSFNVPIRTLTLQADGTGTLGIGSGIVADSDPAGELAECRWKARFVTDLAAEFQLIETLLLDPARSKPYPLLDAHLRRLAASARYFAFLCDVDKTRAALVAHARGLAVAGPERTRLLLDKNGDVSIRSTPIPPASGEVRVVLARQRTDSRDLFRQHKTTVRHEYEAELQRLAALPQIFDAIFCNERGELCEGARSNIYLSFGGVLHTPPESAGLLNGVMRRELLREQPVPIVERTLYPRDLQLADALYISNAVRGLQRVKLVELQAEAPGRMAPAGASASPA